MRGAARHDPPRPAHERGALSAALAAERIAIERVEPSVDGGRFAVKRVIGETLVVHASIFTDGTRISRPRCGAAGDDDWREIRSKPNRTTAGTPASRSTGSAAMNFA